MKKKILFLCGTAVFLFSMAVNINYSVNGYGVKNASIHVAVLGLISGTSSLEITCAPKINKFAEDWQVCYYSFCEEGVRIDGIAGYWYDFGACRVKNTCTGYPISCVGDCYPVPTYLKNCNN